MAIVPHFNGGEQPGVSQPNAPVLDREARPRINASEIMGALGASAQSFANFAVAQPTMPVGAFNGQFAGAQAIVEGLGNLTQALGGIALKRQEAKNYADVAEAETQMAALLEEQENFKARSPDPETWGANWTKLVEGYGKAYSGRSDLSPAAREEIDVRLSRFATLGTLRVEGDATRATFARARKAGLAKIEVAVASGDAGAIPATFDELESAGHLFPEERQALEFDAMERVNGMRRDVLKNQVAADLEAGDATTAKERIRQARDVDGILRADEARAQIAEIEARHEYRMKSQDAEIDALDDPKGFLTVMETGGYDFLSRADQYRYRETAQRQIEEQRRASLSSVKDAIDIDPGRAGRKSVADYDLPQLADLSEVDKGLLDQYLKGEKLNDLSRFNEVRAMIGQYDPATDPVGTRRNDILATVDILFDGDRRKELEQMLESHVSFMQSPKGVEVGELTRTLASRYDQLQADAANGRFGDFRFTGVVQETDENGVEFYGVPDENGNRTVGRVFKRKYRELELSEDDRRNIDAKKPPAFVEDLKSRDKANAELRRRVDAVEAAIKSGAVKSVDEIDAMLNSFDTGWGAKRADAALDSAVPLFGPVGGSNLPADSSPPSSALFPSAALDEILKRYANP